MKKLVILSLVLVVMVQIILNTGVREVLKGLINTRMDASESVKRNTIDDRVYSDFANKKPYGVIHNINSFEYKVGDEVVMLENKNDNIAINISRKDGTRSTEVIAGSVEIKQVDLVNINNETKVDLRNTDSKLYAITYRVYEDRETFRRSMNREFTRYISVTE